MGMFLQSIMLAAREHGLGSCPQASTSDYPELVRKELGVSGQLSLICGLALGYPDNNDSINQYRTNREEVNGFSMWFD